MRLIPILLALVCCSFDRAYAQTDIGRFNCEPGSQIVSITNQDLIRANNIIDRAYADSAKKKEEPFDIGIVYCNIDANGVDLSLIKASEISFQNSIFRNMILDGKGISNINISKSILKDSSFIGSRMSLFYVADSKLENIDFSKSNIRNSEFINTTMRVEKNARGSLMVGAGIASGNIVFDDAYILDSKFDNSELMDVSVQNTRMSNIDLRNAVYQPSGVPVVSGVIAGVETIRFSQESFDPSAVAILREEFRKRGMRELEREATFSIERGQTDFLLNQRSMYLKLDGWFRRFFLEWPVSFGLRPGRALLLILFLSLIMVPVYLSQIAIRSVQRVSRIFLVVPERTIEPFVDGARLRDKALVFPLEKRGVEAILWSMYLSILSTFNIGFREFNVGTWIGRIQPRQFSIECLGWVRVVSGMQSLASLILLALWALTYFGRPFQ